MFVVDQHVDSLEGMQQPHHSKLNTALQKMKIELAFAVSIKISEEFRTICIRIHFANVTRMDVIANTWWGIRWKNLFS